MSIKFRCVECSAAYEVDDKLAGETIHCEECNGWNKVPDFIRCRCVKCGSQIHAPEKLAGRKAKCPKCRAEILVPLPSKSEAALSAPPAPSDNIPTVSIAPIYPFALPSGADRQVDKRIPRKAKTGKVACPGCRKTISVSPERLGQTIYCPCGIHFAVGPKSPGIHLTAWSEAAVPEIPLLKSDPILPSTSRDALENPAHNETDRQSHRPEPESPGIRLTAVNEVAVPEKPAPKKPETWRVAVGCGMLFALFVICSGAMYNISHVSDPGRNAYNPSRGGAFSVEAAGKWFAREWLTEMVQSDDVEVVWGKIDLDTMSGATAYRLVHINDPKAAKLMPEFIAAWGGRGEACYCHGFAQSKRKGFVYLFDLYCRIEGGTCETIHFDTANGHHPSIVPVKNLRTGVRVDRTRVR